MTGFVAGAVVGLGVAMGAVLVLGSVLRPRTPSLAARVVPYLPDRGSWSDPGGMRGGIRDSPTAVGGRARLRSASGVAWVAAWIDRTLGGRRSVAWRLDVLGDDRTVDEFRVDQAIAAGVGATAGLLATGLLGLTAGGTAFFSGVVLTGAGLVLGALAPDWRLTSAIRRREESIAAELPVVAELLALAITAGEGVMAALERVSSSCGGVLAGEFGRVLAEVRAGTRLVTSLRDLSARTRVVSVGRLVDVVVVALERGTPLGEVLRAQAADVTNARRQDLVEESGRRSIAMLVPVVFMILPVTVLFAVYPGLVSIVSLSR